MQLAVNDDFLIFIYFLYSIFMLNIKIILT